ncbi:MAG: PKD domain-containing protein [Bacteroidetes bacterium]|nr:PKD domain-containing protein [Bacteroidota bacterium]
MKRFITIPYCLVFLIAIQLPVVSNGQCTVTIAANPPSATVCAPQTVSLTATPGALGTPPYTYLWSTAATTQTITVNATNTYSVTITDDISCTNDNSVSVTINALPTPAITGAAEVCANSINSVFSTPDVAGDSYLWTVTGGTITAGTNTNEITVTWGAAGSGLVKVKETTTATGCFTEVTKSVSIKPLPSPIITGKTCVCMNLAGVIYSTALVSGHTLVWTVTGGSITGGQNTNQIIVTWGAAGSGTVEVRETITATGCYKDASLNISISSTFPPSAFTVVNNNICSEETMNFQAPAGTGYTYLWNFGDPSSGVNNASTLQNPGHIFKTYGCGTINYNVILTVTTSCGCSSASTPQVVSIKQQPKPRLADPDPYTPFSNCDNNPTPANHDFELTVNNTSTNSSCITGYTINWGDGGGDIPFPAGFTTTSHTYTELGAFNLKITAVNSNGCSNDTTYIVANQSNPAVGISAAGSTSGCLPVTWPFTISGAANNSPGTNYRIEFGDGASIIKTNDELLIDSIVPHEYITSSCGQGLTGNQFIVKVTAVNACDSTYALVSNVKVYKPPVANFTSNPIYIGCVNSQVCFSNTTINGYGLNCIPTSVYSWNFGDPLSGTNNTSTATNPCHTYTEPGTYTITLVSSNGPCPNASTHTKTICINPQPNSSFAVNQDIGCKPLTINATNQSTTPNNCGDLGYTWSVVFNGSGTCIPSAGDWIFASGTDLHSQNATFIFNDPGTYTITLAVQNSCTTITSTKTITVKSVPKITVDPIPAFCAEGTVSPAATFPECYGTITAWNWTFTGGLPASANTPSPGIITYNSPGNYTITASATNECGVGTGTTPLTVKPLPVVSVSLPDQTICSGSASQEVTIATTITGTTYSWSTISSPGITGAPVNGVANPIPGWTLTNANNTAGTVTVTITPTANGCTGTPITHIITVNPKPLVSNLPLTQSVCSGIPTVEVILTSNVTGTTFAWSAMPSPATLTGFTTGGTAVIPVQTINNPTTANGTVTYSITPTANGCDGTGANYVITVKPIPGVSNSPMEKTICSGISAGVILTSGVTGATYSWSSVVTAGSVTGNSLIGTGNITNILTNSGITLGTVQYSITPTANGCAGLPATYTVNVQPVADVTLSSTEQTICAGTPTTPVSLTSSVSGALFSWIPAANPTTGMSGYASANTGNSIPVMTINSTLIINGTVTYTITPSIGGCNGTVGTHTITVNPAPSVITTPGPQSVCSGFPTVSVALSSNVGGLVTYDWTATGSSPNVTGYSTGGSGNIPLQNLINSGSVIETVTYHIVPTFSGGSGLNCPGVPLDYIITVKPLPTGSAAPFNQAVCSGLTSLPIALSSSINPGATFSWTTISSSGITGAPANGATNPIPAWTLSNSTNSAGTVTIAITPTVNGCPGNLFTHIITVNPKPSVSNNPLTQLVCSGIATTVEILTSNVSGATFIWSATPSPATLTGFTAGGTNTIPVQTINNPTTANGTVTYSITPTANGCNGTVANYVITVKPLPQVSNSPLSKTICSGINAGVTLTSGVTGATYIWSSSVSAGNVTGNTVSGNGNIDDYLINAGNTLGTVQYSITPTANGCAGPTAVYTVNVQPVANVIQSQTTQTICAGTSTTAVNLTSNVAGASFSWTPVANPTSGMSGYVSANTGNSIPQMTVNSTLVVPGTVTYTITPSIGGCNGTAGTHIITVNPAPSVVTNPGPQSVCSGVPTTSVALSSNVGGAVTYDWTATGSSANVTGYSTGGTGNIPLQNLINSGSVNETVTYHIIPTFSGGSGLNCPGVPLDYIVAVKPIPVISSTPPNQAWCSGIPTLPITFNSSILSGTTYTWTASPTNGITGAQSGGTANPIPAMTLVNPSTTTGTVTFYIASAADGCNGNQITNVVTVNPVPVITTVPSAIQTICSGNPTNIQISSNVTSASISYSAALTSGAVTGMQNGIGSPIAQVLINTGITAGSVTYTITCDANGCTSTKTIVVTVNPKPVVTTVPSPNQEICSGTGTSIALSSNITGTSITWIPSLTSGTASGFTPGAGSPISQTLINASSSAAAVVTYTISSVVNGCTGTIINYPVTINPLPIANAGANQTIGYDTFTSLNGQGTGGTGTLGYSWEPAGSIATGQNTQTPQTTNLTQTTTFTLQVNDTKNCTSSGNVIITVSGNAISAQCNANPTAICNNGASVQLSSSGAGGSGTYTYSWSSSPPGFTSMLQNPLITPTVTTTFTVTVDDGFNSATNSVAVTVNPLPTPFGMTGGGEYCAGGIGKSVDLDGSEQNFSYQCKRNGSDDGVPVVGNGGVISFGLKTLAGVYTAECTNPATGCVSPMNNSVSISVNPLPSVEAGNDKIVSYGTWTTLAGAASGGTGTLSPGWTPYDSIFSGWTTLTPQTKNRYSTSYFKLTVTDTKTCVSKDSMRVIVNGNALNVIAEVIPTPICDGQTAQLTATASGGSGAFGYNWVSDPAGFTSTQQNPMVSPSETTSYTVAVNDGFNAASASVTLIVNPLPISYNVTGGGSYCFGGTGVEIILENSETGVNYQLFRGSVPLTPTIDGSTGSPVTFGYFTIEGTYTVKATRTITGCENLMTGSAAVTILPLPGVFTVTGGGSYPAGGSGVPVGLSESETGVNYMLYNGVDPVTTPPGIPGIDNTPIDFGNQTLAGSYTVVATNAITGCVSDMAGNVTVVINPYPSLFNVYGGGQICLGEAGKEIGLNGSETGIRYILRRNNDSIAQLPGNGDSLHFGIFNIAGTYTIKGVTIATGLIRIMTGSAVIVVNPLPIAYLMIPQGDTCYGAEILLNGSEAGINYYLINGADTILMVAGTGLFGLLTFGHIFDTGTFRLVAINPVTGCKNDMIGTVTLHPAPELFDVVPPGILCPGQTVLLTGSQIGIDYQLRRDSLTNVGLPISGTGFPLDFGAQYIPGKYQAIGYNPLTHCYSWMNLDATIQPAPIVFNILPSLDTCAPAIVRLNGSQMGISYRLTFNNTVYLDSLYGTGQPLIFGTYQTAGVYRIIAIDTLTHCEYAMGDSLRIFQSPIPYHIIPNGIDCANSNIGLEDSEIGVNYKLIRDGWIFAAGPVAGTGNPISFGNQYYSGVYKVEGVFSATSCHSDMNGSTVLNPLPISYILHPQNAVCAGTDLYLNGSDIGIEYELRRDGIGVITKPGTGLLLHFGLQFLEGIYSVYAVDTWSACDTMMTGSVAVLPLPLAFNLTPEGGNCSPAEVGLSGSQVGVNYQLYRNGFPTGIPAQGTGLPLTFGSQPAGNYIVIAQIAATSCADTMPNDVIITNGPHADAGNDAAICETNTIQLSGIASGYSAVLWSTQGDGSFSDPAILNPVYTPGNTDNGSGSVRLAMKVFGSPACLDKTDADTLVVTINPFPLVEAGLNDTICATGAVSLHGFAQNYSICQWHTSGDGIFDNSITLNPVYTPGSLDKQSGAARLKLSVYGILTCLDDMVSDSLNLVIDQLPSAYAGIDDTICENQTYRLTGIPQRNSSVLWTTAGDGSFDDPTKPDALYTPGANDRLVGSAPLVFSALGIAQCTAESDHDTMNLALIRLPIVDVGRDTTLCANQAYQLAALAQRYSNLEWNTTGDGIFSDRYIANPLYSPGSADSLAGSVMLKLTAHGLSDCSVDAVSDSLVLSLYPMPLANAGNDTLTCPNVPVPLHGSATHYTALLWSALGDGVFSNPTIMNPSYLPGSSDILTGYTDLKLTVNGEAKCTPAIDSDTVRLIFKPLPTVTLNGSDTICEGYNGNLIATLGGIPPWSIVYSDGMNNFTAANIPSSPFTFTVAPIVTTTYTILNISDGNCSVTSTGPSFTINVIPQPNTYTMTVANGGGYCEGGVGVEIGIDGSQVGIFYQLLSGGMPSGFPIPGTGSPISFGMKTIPGIYQVRAFHPQTLCDVQFGDSVAVVVFPTPRVDFTGDSTCYQQLTQFHLNGLDISRIALWEWNFGDGNSSSFTAPVEPSHLYPATGIFQVTLTVTDTNNCSKTLVHAITVNELPVAMFSHNAPMCSGYEVLLTDYSYAPGNNFLIQWHWEFGDGSDTLILLPDLPDVSHIYNIPGTYQVKLTVKTNQGCLAEKIRTIDISPAPMANFDFSNSCEDENVHFTDISQLQGGGSIVEWSWNFGDPSSGWNNTSIQQSPIHVFDTVGIYRVRLIVMNSGGCTDTILTIVTVHAGPRANFTTTAACLGSITQFTDTSVPNATANIEWIWNFGDGSPTSTIQNPTHTYANPGIFAVTLTVKNSNFCSRDTTLNVEVLPLPVAAFITNSPVCSGAAVIYTNSSTTLHGQIVKWVWNFGDGSPDTTILFPGNPNVTHTFAGTASQHTVRLTVKTSDSCVSFIEHLINSVPAPAANFAYTPNLCPEQNVFFTDLSQPNGGGPVTAWLWNFGNPTSGFFNTSVLQNPSHTFTGAASYNVSLIVRNGNNCANTISKPVTIQPEPTAAFSFDMVCKGNMTHFTDNSIANAPSIIGWDWDFGDGLPHGTVNNPVHLYSNAGSYTVTLTVTNSNQCTKSVSHTVIVYPNPVPLFTYSNVTCAGSPVSFFDESTASHGYILQWLWNFGDGHDTTINFPGVQEVLHTYSSGGTYNVILTVKTSDSCTSSLTNAINVISHPFANFSNPATNCEQSPVQFSDLSQPNGGGAIMTWNWNFDDPGSGVNNFSPNQNPLHIFSTNGSYDVQLIVENVNQCSNTIVKTVIISDNPVAKFTVDTVCKGLSTHFTDASLPMGGTINSWSWNFGDGSPLSTIQSPTHLYVNSGSYNVTLSVATITGCLHDTAKQAVVKTPPDANFSIAGHCKGSLTHFTDLSTTPGGAITQREWHFGDGDTSTLPNPTHLYANPGAYTVKLIVWNTSACADSITIPLVIFDKPVAAFTSFSKFCPAGEVTFTDHTIAAGAPITSWLWTFGAGSFNTAQNPVVTFPATGVNQAVQLIVHDDNECYDTIDSTIFIKPAFAFTFDATSACFGLPTQFTPVNLAPGDSLSSLHWTFGESSSGSGNFSTAYTPAHTYSAAQTFIVKLKAYNSDNCYDSVFREIIVNPLPTVDITYNAGPHCDSVITFHQTTSGNGVALDSLRWQFGDGSDTTFIPPCAANIVHRYSGYGFFEAVVTAFNHNGCEAVDTARINVACISASFINRDTLVCEKMKVVLYDSSTPVNLIKSWKWSFGDGSPDTTYAKYTNEITHTWNLSGNKIVTLIVEATNNGFTVRDTTRLNLFVKSSPVSAFSVTSICAGDSSRFINLSDSAGASIVASKWKFGDGATSTTDTSTALNPVYKYKNPGKFTVKLLSVNNLGCSDALQKQAIVFRLPDAQFVNGKACERYDIAFGDHSVPGDTSIAGWFWNFSAPGFLFDTISGKDVINRYEQFGAYNVYMKVEDINGCSDTISKIIEVAPSPIAAFTITDNFDGRTGQIRLNNKSSDSAFAFAWTFEPGKNSKEKNPVYQFTEDGKYIIQLVARFKNGCYDTTSLQYEFLYDNLFVPNAFSPTNLDGLGCREFKPKGMNLRDYHVMVFDKWGHLIWESQVLTSDDKGMPKDGWDGTFNGEPMPQDVYMWKINATFTNGKVWEGSESGTGGVSTMGTVTLIR